MAQIDVSSLKTGTTFKENNHPYRVLKYSHTKMGRGGATIRVKVQNLKTNATTEKTYHSGSSVEAITTQKRPLQFLYKEDQSFIFMDPKTYNQFTIDQVIVGSQAIFLKEGESVDVLFWQPSLQESLAPLAVDLPPKMTFTVAQTPPGVRGNSATNLSKPAKLNNGIQVKVPLFIKTGDKIRIDTRTGDYIERAK